VKSAKTDVSDHMVQPRDRGEAWAGASSYDHRLGGPKGSFMRWPASHDFPRRWAAGAAHKRSCT